MKTLIIVSIGLSLSLLLYIYYQDDSEKLHQPIRVGILHSLSGTMAISESAVVDATLFSIKQINDKGGLLGRSIETIVADTKSDPKLAAKEAERLIVEEKVDVLFGCWTSACRKSVKPIVEKYNHLLFYPVQFEGVESSTNIVYTGSTPNQQLSPALYWALNNIGEKFFLVGSDYIFPRMINEIAKDYIKAKQAKVVGEEYITLGSNNVGDMIQKIKDSDADVIISSINGDSNVAFFRALQQSGITASEIPVISLSIGEQEIEQLQNQEIDLTGQYASWTYFQSIDSDENRQFIRDFKNEYGENRVFTDPMQSARVAVNLWAQTVTHNISVNISMLITSLSQPNNTVHSLQGLVSVDHDSMHLRKWPRIGKIKSDGQFEIVWQTDNAFGPKIYPITRTKIVWMNTVTSYYHNWNNQWKAVE